MAKILLPFLLLGLLGLASCDDPPDEERKAAEQQQALLAEARRAAEEQVRARLRIVGDMHLRAIQVYPQQIAGSFAVCGQVNPSGAAADPFIPWVSAVTLQDGKASRATLAIGLSNLEASRVYLEMVDRCFAGGGPRTAQAPSTTGLPPLPADSALSPPPAPPSAPPQAQGTTPPAAPPAPPGGHAAPPPPAPPSAQPNSSQGSITTTAAHPVNVRSSPAGGGAIVRIVPRSSVLRVFGNAPGGWLQVGEEQPIGWLHESMLER
jgi:hypothetical protein